MTMQEENTRLCMAAAGEDGMLIAGEARRDAVWFAPPGYMACPEPGTAVLAADLGGSPIGLGVPMPRADLVPGEVRLTAGAAELRLCPDGRVYLNGVEITPAGTSGKGGGSDGSSAS